LTFIKSVESEESISECALKIGINCDCKCG